MILNNLVRHSPTNYYPHIDGLRAIAILVVVFHHLIPSVVPGGYVGVDIFFVISGYLIAGIIKREIEENKFTFIGFYERRVRRIFPALFAVLIFTCIFGYIIFLPSDFNASLRGILGTLFFVSNIVFWRDLAEGYFAATEAGLNPTVHTWSLAVEEQFYIFFPILLVVLYKLKINKIPLILSIIFIISLFVSEYFLNTKPVFTFFFTPFRVWELLAGVLLVFNILPEVKNKVVRELLSFIGLIALLYPCFYFNNETSFPGLNALIPVLGSVTIIHLGKKEDSLVKSILKLPLFVYVGLFSYSLYLWHWPIIVFSKFLKNNIAFLDNFVIVFILSIIISIFSYHFIEQPFRGKKGKENFSRKMVFNTSTILILIVSTFTFYGVIKNGFEKRFSEEILTFDKARKPDIFYKHCDNIPKSENWCIIGNKKAKAQTLLFGDSHLMSWAHVFDEIFMKKNEGAVLAMLSACPPIFRIKYFGSEFRKDGSCSRKSYEVERYLKDNKEIKNIIIVGVWSQYFSGTIPLKVILDDKIDYSGPKAAHEGTIFTIKRIKELNKNIILIGPVPTYEESVPFLHAISLKNNKNFKSSNNKLQKEFNSNFYNLLKSYKDDYHFIDPINMMCKPKCLTVVEGKSIYFDSNHLNRYGSLYFENEMAIELNNLLIK